MRKLALGLVMVAVLLGGCSSKASVTTASPTPAGTPAPDPQTAAYLKYFAQIHFNSFAEGDYGTFYDDFDSDAKQFITRDEYVRRLTGCMQYDPNKFTPMGVRSVVDNKNGTWSVNVAYGKIGLTFPARYEAGHWRFSLSPEAKANLRLPMSQYLATKCAKKP
jgi:hypothetical protein